MKKLILPILTMLASAVLFSSCGNIEVKSAAADSTASATTAAVIAMAWGETDGKPVQLFTLTNKKGDEVKITNYGGIVTSWITQDKTGSRSNVVVGFDSLDGYLRKPPYFGAIIGRYGNRIGNATFKLNDTTYKLAANNGKNNLHGGKKGFDKVVWNAAPSADGNPSLTLTYLSPDGEEGFPGNLNTTVKYTLTEENELLIEYEAETDKATPVNLTNHSYFNLTGDAGKSILGHTLWIDADNYTPVDAGLIPTGKIATVKGTPFDFTGAKKIGDRIAQVSGGYDHNYVLNNKATDLKLVAWLQDSVSGRKLEVFTTEPGLQFYSGNFLDGTIQNRDGKKIAQHNALCLETQHFPDSPNKPAFPSTILQPGEKYNTTTKYKVSLAK
ncbi:MAG TPA: aldose epimerase family protein [Flavisolibacter sp.]|jgi:aldose 1-epimerase|nr:aldose epimerase family protein [Flavisolibacter sp.]